MDGELMQSITRELNLAECIFITAGAGPDYSARIFTPGMEMPFAGHPTIGCGTYLFAGPAADHAELTLRLLGGKVTVWRDTAGTGLVYFEPPPVTLGAHFDDLQLAARLIGLQPDDVATDIAPVQHVSVGLQYLIVPLRSREALERCVCDTALLKALWESHGINQLGMFCLDPYSADGFGAVRMFAPFHGVPEDPATGSLASCLATYLRAHDVIGDIGDGWLKLDQGYSIHRPSAIFIRANLIGEQIDVRIGGHAVLAARGELQI
jgi:trans-2,3-dihydro-3-hydroxyanthranilate isomerase